MLREVDGKTCSSVSCEGGVSAVGCLTESYLHMELRSGLPPVLLHHWVASPDGLVRMRVADARWWRIAFPGKALGKRIWHFRMDKNNVSTRFLHCHNARSRHWLRTQQAHHLLGEEISPHLSPKWPTLFPQIVSAGSGLPSHWDHHSQRVIQCGNRLFGLTRLR
ncbi:uncharacterized protein LOC125454040 isoform X3 [Stegostoma tigrinum]|uniref:uncharacterized protein LOC125454040 isoform X3 n=1 Tax=Stegostoma tigrinum TaxID=3053191 RepID=UPI00202ACE1E|nr:uncharacterized protein LOC125454040 isoform X3 [Stegostoma tigrinum]